MPDVRRCCSDLVQLSVGFGAKSLVFGASLFLVACNGSDTLDLSTTHTVSPLEEKPILEAALPGRVKTKDAEKPKVRTSSDVPEKREMTFDVRKAPELTARCRYILATTGAENTMLRSPTLSTEIDDEGDIGLNLGFDVLDLRRARLKKELAIARCHQHNALNKLRQMLISSPQALTRAGYLAKSSVLRANRKKVLGIRRKVDQALKDGDITLSRATLLRQYANQVLSLEASARGEAARRQVVDEFQASDVRGLDDMLIASEARIQAVQRKLRTIDALKVNVSGGYTTSDSGDDSLLGQDGDFSGNVKMSVRLGAFSKTRKTFEDEAQSARQDALFEDGNGIFWRARQIAEANGYALRALTVQRDDIRNALSEARRSSELASSFGGTDLIGPALRSQLDAISLAADLAGIEATMADSKRIDRRLRFQ